MLKTLSMLITQCLKCHAFLRERAELHADRKVYLLKCDRCGEYLVTPEEIDSLKRERERCGGEA